MNTNARIQRWTLLLLISHHADKDGDKKTSGENAMGLMAATDIQGHSHMYKLTSSLSLSAPLFLYIYWHLVHKLFRQKRQMTTGTFKWEGAPLWILIGDDNAVVLVGEQETGDCDKRYEALFKSVGNITDMNQVFTVHKSGLCEHTRE